MLSKCYLLLKGNTHPWSKLVSYSYSYLIGLKAVFTVFLGILTMHYVKYNFTQNEIQVMQIQIESKLEKTQNLSLG